MVLFWSYLLTILKGRPILNTDVKTRLILKEVGVRTMTVKILVCDDDPTFVNQLVELINRQPKYGTSNISITGCSDPSQLNDKMLSEFNIMFLDIDMGQYSGLSIARRVRNLQLNSLLIFVTHYVEFSLEGYEINAFRYLLKESLSEKLPIYFKEAMMQFAQKGNALKFTASGEDYVVQYENIVYLESHLRIIHLHTRHPERINEYFYATMEEMEKELSPAGFLRIHKSYLVNMQHIKKLNYDRAQLSDDTILPVSQKKFSEIKLRYMNWKAQQ